MNLRSYLPSAHFSTIIGSIAIAAGLVFLAQYVTSPKTTSAVLTAAPTASEQNWQAAFNEVQADAPGLPSAPDEGVIQSLREAAKSSNVTTSVARSLFVNLTDAGAQGLGSDLPTQEKLVAEAASQIEADIQVAYTLSDLRQVPQTSASLKTWGNGVMRVFSNNSKANNDATLIAMGQAADYADTSAIQTLKGISSAYAALADDLAALETPSTVAPLYVQLINDLSRMSAGADLMGDLLKDPLRGLGGLQAFQSAGNEASRVLTTLAGQLSKSGILFNKDEPGAAWSVFVSSYPQ